MSRWLFLPDSAVKDLAILASLRDDQIRDLLSVFTADAGKGNSAIGLRIAELLLIPDQDAAGLYTLWRYVQEERRKAEKTAEDVLSEFAAFLKAKANSSATPTQQDRHQRVADTIAARRGNLESLFEECPERDKSRKAETLGLGPLPHLATFQSLCDVRPIYDEDASRIEALAAVFTLRLVTHGNSNDYDEQYINIAEDDIKVIEEEMKRLRDKLQILKREFPGIATSSSHTQRRRARS